MMSRTKLVYLEPYTGESFPHYLGRLRRLMGNNLPSASSLGEAIGVGAVVAQWEQGYLNPFPSVKQLTALGTAVGLEVDRLVQMLPSEKDALDPRPIRLCGACYAECPCHRIEWQFKSRLGAKCDRHKLKLLMKCPGCKTLFPEPSHWIQGRCHNKKCGMQYSEMVKHQRAI